MTTLKELLNLPRFSDLKVMTTDTDLTHIVESIEITETPDVALYMPQNVFLLTTAMSFQNNQKGLIPMIDSLIQAQSAGLGIKIGRYIDTIDPEVLAYAEEKDFPIIQIPSTVPLGTLLHKLLSYIWDSKTEQMTYALDIQKRFSHLLINDASLAKIIAEFGKMIQTPVILLNPYKEVVAHSQHFTSASKPTNFYIDQLVSQNLLSIDANEDIVFIQDKHNCSMQASVYGIRGNSYFPYYLVILRPEQIPYPVSEFAVEQAILILSFVIFKNIKVKESWISLKSDYFQKIISSQNQNNLPENSWYSVDLDFDLTFSNYYQVIYVSCLRDEKSKFEIKYNQEKTQIAYHWIENKIAKYLKDAIVFPLKNNNEFAIILQNSDETETIAKVLKQLAEELERKLPISLVYSIGYSYSSIEMIATSYIEAKMTYDERIKNDTDERIIYYHPKGMLNLFDRIQQEEIRYFCHSTLKELAYPTNAALMELRKTLKAFLSFQCEITKTSNELFIHRNTVKYRIDNIEEILGYPINDPANSLNLRLALELSSNTQEE